MPESDSPWYAQAISACQATEAALKAVNEAIDRLNPIHDICELAYARAARDALKAALPSMQCLNKLESYFQLL